MKWKKIEGYPGYEVSDEGVVRRGDAMSTVDDLMALHDKAAAAWHANQSSRVVAAYDDGLERKALRAAIEAALKAREQVWFELGRDSKPCIGAASPTCNYCGQTLRVREMTTQEVHDTGLQDRR